MLVRKGLRHSCRWSRTSIQALEAQVLIDKYGASDSAKEIEIEMRSQAFAWKAARRSSRAMERLNRRTRDMKRW